MEAEPDLDKMCCTLPHSSHVVVMWVDFYFSQSKDHSSKDTWKFFFQHVKLGGELLPHLLAKSLVLAYRLHIMLVEKTD